MSAGASGNGRGGGGGDYLLAALLVVLAGAVDAVGFLHWRGLFVSFMSGNSTILGVATAQGDGPKAGVALAIVCAFVAGVVAGDSVAPMTAPHRRPFALLVEAVLLGGGGVASFLGAPEIVFAPLLSAAMGVQNAAVRQAAGVSVALTYVTGTLVQVGRSLAAALRGAGTPSAALPHLGLWCSLVVGAAGGTALLARLPEAVVLWGAAGAAFLSAGVAALASRTRRERQAGGA